MEFVQEMVYVEQLRHILTCCIQRLIHLAEFCKERRYIFLQLTFPYLVRSLREESYDWRLRGEKGPMREQEGIVYYFTVQKVIAAKTQKHVLDGAGFFWSDFLFFHDDCFV